MLGEDIRNSRKRQRRRYAVKMTNRSNRVVTHESSLVSRPYCIIAFVASSGFLFAPEMAA